METVKLFDANSWLPPSCSRMPLPIISAPRYCMLTTKEKSLCSSTGPMLGSSIAVSARKLCCRIKRAKSRTCLGIIWRAVSGFDLRLKQRNQIARFLLLSQARTNQARERKSG
jgi:hypothetical protein